MWELERESDLPDLTRLRCAIVGAGRLGRALAPALLDAGIATSGPLGRGADGGDADVVLLCVPDAEIADAAAAIAPRPAASSATARARRRWRRSRPTRRSRCTR